MKFYLFLGLYLQEWTKEDSIWYFHPHWGGMEKEQVPDLF